MSSEFVRQEVITFIQTELSGENLIDLTAAYSTVNDLLTDNGLGTEDEWLGLQFVGADETPVDILGTNSRGKYREIGVIFLHITDYARPQVHQDILTRGKQIRDKFRGQRIADKIIIEKVSPVNFGEGVALSFEDGYVSGVVQVDYQYDLDL